MSKFQRLAINWQFFAAALIDKRWQWGGSLRDWAQRTGLSYATLSRAESGREISAENYLTLCRFIGVDPLSFTKVSRETFAQGVEFKGEAAE